MRLLVLEVGGVRSQSWAKGSKLPRGHTADIGHVTAPQEASSVIGPANRRSRDAC